MPAGGQGGAVLGVFWRFRYFLWRILGFFRGFCGIGSDFHLNFEFIIIGSGDYEDISRN